MSSSSSSLVSSAGSVAISEALVAALQACSLAHSCLPHGVTSCMSAAFHLGVPEPLRGYSLDYVDLFGPDTIAPPSVEALPAVPPPSSDPAVARSSQLKQISALRAVLPEGCERAMLGSEHSVRQASPAMCEEALMVKFRASAGPQGGAAARDRRDLHVRFRFYIYIIQCTVCRVLISY